MNGVHKPSVSTMREKKEPPAVSTTERCLLSFEISLLSAIAPALTAVNIVLGCNTLETEMSKKMVSHCRSLNGIYHRVWCSSHH